MNAKPTIAILGGTGDLGSGLAKCWLAAGYKVILGSRSAEKARHVAGTMTGDVSGEDNIGAASGQSEFS
jgi:predicted dinucleotide-binding enzyme